MEDVLIPYGALRAHTGPVTSIQTPLLNAQRVVSASRDKSVMVWALQPDSAHGRALRRLTGHSHFVEDVAVSQDGEFALSASWDRDLRLWDLSTSSASRPCLKRFVGHTNDALSVALSPDNRQIVSGSRDNSLRLWNTLGECKYVLSQGGSGGHTGWVSSVRFGPNPTQPVVVSGSWDSTVRVWDAAQCKMKHTLTGHKGYVNAVAVSPDGTLIASGGRDGVAMLWDLAEGGQRLYEMNAGAIIHALGFSPSRYWLCAATERSVVIWDLEQRSLVQELFPGLHQLSPSGAPEDEAEGGRNGGWKTEHQQLLHPPLPPVKKNQRVYCTSLSWSANGSTLFTGYTDGVIRVWSLRPGYY